MQLCRDIWCEEMIIGYTALGGGKKYCVQQNSLELDACYTERGCENAGFASDIKFWRP